MKRAVLYARVSGDDRGKEGRNLAGQLATGRKYAQEHGYVIVEELSEDDRGASGAEIDLPELNQIREMAEAGDFDVLVVREIDRLSRNLAKQLIVEQELKQVGVQIEYVLGEYPDTPEGRLNKHIKATIAEYEREKIVERTTRARRQKVEAGHVIVHGRPPYGYRLGEVNGKRALVTEESEARVVRLVFTWYTVGDGESGPMSILAIARRLTRERIPTRADNDPHMAKQQAYGHWNRASVTKMLRRETYAGVWHYGKVGVNDTRRILNPRESWIPVQVPAIVSREIWEAAQEQMKRNRRNSSRNTKYHYLLRRRVTCGNCGVKMNAMTTSAARGRHAYYVCPAHSRPFEYARTCDQKAYFRVDQVDPAVWGWIKSFLTDPAALAEGLRAEQAERERINKPLRDRLAVVDDLLIDNRRQLERVLDLYLSGDFAEEMLTVRKGSLQDTIRALERERANLTAQLETQTLSGDQVETIKKFAQEIATGLENAEHSFEARRRLVDLLDVQVTLAIEDGQKIGYARCILGEVALPIVPTTTGRCYEVLACRRFLEAFCPPTPGVSA